MKLNEVESLVRRISALLREPADAPQAARWAQDFADQARLANRRLEQCALMLEQGNPHQALELAEAPPPLLDLVTLLAFQRAADWRGYCQERGYPVAETLDGKAVQALNAAYSKGASAPHPLYRDYRDAMLRNAPEEALAALRVILKVDPDDGNAPREAARLEERILKARLDGLREALEAGQASEVAGLVQEMEALGLRVAPSGEVWQSARRVQCGLLLRQAQAARLRDAVPELEAALEEIGRICRLESLELEAEAAASLADSQAWLGARRQALADAEAARLALRDLRRLLEAIELKQVSAQRLTAAEVRGELEALLRKQMELERLGQTVPEELARRVQLNQRALQAVLRQQARFRRNLLVATVVLVFGAVLITGAQLLSRNRAREAALELDRLIRSRQVVAAERYLAQVRQQQAGKPTLPALAAALNLADGFLQREYQQWRLFEQVAGELTNSAALGFTNLSVAQLQTRLTEASGLTNTLAPDFVPLALVRLVSVQNRWEAFLEAQRRLRTTELQQLLQEAAPRVATALDYARGVESLETGVQTLEPLFGRLAPLANPGVEGLKPSADLLGQYESLQRRWDEARTNVSQWREIEAVLRAPPGPEQYLVALKGLRRSRFAPAPQAAAAAEVETLQPAPSAETLLAGALAASPELLQHAAEHPAVAFHPTNVLETERAKYNALRDDENIHAVRVCRLVDKTRVVSETRLAYARGLLTTNRAFRPQGVVYDPGASASALQFQQREFMRANYDLTDLGLAAEARAFERTGLKDLMDGPDRYRGGLLACLDQLNSEGEASPLFRAYLMLRLGEFLDLRRWEWAAPYAPALAAHRRTLAQLGAGALQTGDWLVPARQSALAEPLEQHFAAARRVNYVKQATLLHRLIRRALDAGMAFAGYVDAEGKLVTPPGGPRGELWGWAARTRSPALLFRDAGASRRAVGGVEPLLFTPVFAFGANRLELLAEAAQGASLTAPELAAATRFLPPLYSTAHD